MKKLVTLALTTLSCVVLSACSGGSGGKGSSTTPVATTATATQTSAANTIGIPQIPTSPTGTAFYLIRISNSAEVVGTDLTHSDLTSITVDGQQLVYVLPGVNAGTWATIGDNITCCGKFTDVRFGHVDGRQREYFFYNGNPTKTMPTSGTANYTGYSLITINDDLYPQFENKVDFIRGTTELKADFSGKKLTGSLTYNGVQPVNINATINGNSFNGKANSGTFRTAAGVDGKFYGDNAKELGGFFSDSQGDWAGAFGAAQ